MHAGTNARIYAHPCTVCTAQIVHITHKLNHMLAITMLNNALHTHSPASPPLPPPLQVYKASLAPKTAASDPFCKYDDPMISLFVSVLFLAGIPGAFLGSWTNNWFGRRPTMMIGGCFFFVGAVLMSAALHIAMLVVGRISLGIGIGICVQCGPLFLSELAPAHLRGMFNTQFQVGARVACVCTRMRDC